MSAKARDRRIVKLGAAMKEAEQLRAAARELYFKILRELQKDCKHPKIAECDYEPSSLMFGAAPPRRVCEICGLDEQGWGCGYKVLVTNRLRTISRDELYRIRRLLDT